RDGSTVTNTTSDTNISAFSASFADFKLLPQNSPSVNLPVTLANGSYQYNMAVKAGQTYYLDPSVATGYIYKTNPGDPNFASVILPAIQSGAFQLTFVDGLGNLITVDLFGGEQYFFTELAPFGVNSFTVTGIDPNLFLDPSNTTAFVTGLT